MSQFQLTATKAFAQRLGAEQLAVVGELGYTGTLTCRRT